MNNLITNSYVVLTINRRSVRALIDSGSPILIINEQLAKQLHLKSRSFYAGETSMLFPANSSQNACCSCCNIDAMHASRNSGESGRGTLCEKANQLRTYRQSINIFVAISVVSLSAVISGRKPNTWALCEVIINYHKIQNDVLHGCVEFVVVVAGRQSRGPKSTLTILLEVLRLCFTHSVLYVFLHIVHCMLRILFTF